MARDGNIFAFFGCLNRYLDSAKTTNRSEHKSLLHAGLLTLREITDSNWAGGISLQQCHWRGR